MIFTSIPFYANDGIYGICRETLLYYVTSGNDVQVLGSLCILATLLQTKGMQLLTFVRHFFSFLGTDLCCCFLIIHPFCAELDESMLDALGILPQRKQHKKLLLVCDDS